MDGPTVSVGSPPTSSQSERAEMVSGMLGPALADRAHQTEAVQAVLNVLAKMQVPPQEIKRLYEDEAAIHDRVLPKNPAPSLEAVAPPALLDSLRSSGGTTKP